MFVYYATVYAAIQDVIEPRLRGTAVAIYFCFMYILGASMGPVGTGFLSDHFARKAMTDAGASTMTEASRPSACTTPCMPSPCWRSPRRECVVRRRDEQGRCKQELVP